MYKILTLRVAPRLEIPGCSSWALQFLTSWTPRDTKTVDKRNRYRSIHDVRATYWHKRPCKFAEPVNIWTLQDCWKFTILRSDLPQEECKTFSRYLWSTWYDWVKHDPKKPCELTSPANEIHGLKNPYVSAATGDVMIYGPPAVKRGFMIPPIGERAKRKQRNTLMKYMESNILERIAV